MDFNFKMLHTFSGLIFLVVLVLAEVETAVFPEGDQYSYQFSNDVFIKDFKNGRPVAYRLVGTVNVANILTADDDVKLLKFTLESPELHVRPHGSDSQTEFKYHKSPLDGYKNNDFYAVWSAGNVSTIYYNSKENLALVNVKKSIVSLFHYKTSEGSYTENRGSGQCEVTYRDTSPTSIRRMKQNCVSETKAQHIIRPEEPLKASVQNHRSTDYQFFPDGSIEKIESRDYFHIALEANREIGGSVDSRVVLRTDGHLTKTSKADTKTPKEFLSQLKNYKGETLETSRQHLEVSLNSNIKKAIKEHVDDLATSNIGTVQSAKAFLNILPIARVAKKEEIVELLQSKKLNKIKPQILDILGAAGTVAAHDSVKKVVDFQDEMEFDNVERYLQALAIGSRPNSEIILDLLKLVNDKSIGEKVKITAIHTLGSMARRYAAQSNESYSSDVVAKVQNYFNESIVTCTDIPCYVQYLNGINNLQSIGFIDQLFEYVNDTDRSISVAAMKALRSFPASVWNENHIRQFEEIFYQVEKRFDSSVRTLALDIVLNSKFSEPQLKKLLAHLKAKDRAFEVKKYLLEMVQMFSSENQELNEQVQRIIKSDSELNNYHIIAQKGMTTALSRKYSVRSPFNGTLTSIQEIFGGILKRGTVDLTIDSPKESYSYFTLGLYSGGLTSFVSSNTDTNEDNDEVAEEPANAGMEITVQGSYLRPLQFFSGQGELMGHVWSGTASEPTPAYLANTLLHDHHETLQIQNGATVHIDIESALSIDLNGAIQLSLWGRNAQIQVDKNVGLYIAGKILVNAGFVTLDLNFNLEKEPKLNLNTDVDFSSENVLCMQLSQPDDVFRYEMVKNQIIPEIKHHVKSIKKFKYNIAGITHYLNKKNNEMCNKIFAS